MRAKIKQLMALPPGRICCVRMSEGYASHAGRVVELAGRPFSADWTCQWCGYIGTARYYHVMGESGICVQTDEVDIEEGS